MALFVRKNSMQQLEKALSALRSRAALLDSKRTAAKSDLDRALAARERFMLEGDIEGDEKTAGKLQSAVDSAMSALAGFDAAILTQAALVADAEQKLAAEKQAAERKIASEKLTAQITAVDEMMPKWLEFSRKLAAALEVLPQFEAGQMATYLRNATSELENASAMTRGELERMVAAIRDGGQPIPRPPAPVPTLEIVPSEPTLTVFVTRNIKYVGADGSIVCCGQNRRADLPARIAELAFASNMAVPLTDKKRIQTFEGFSGMLEPLPENCSWVGPHGKEPLAKFVKTTAPVVHSSLGQFTAVDRGPPYKAGFSRPSEPEPEPEPLTGTRSAEDEQ
jgi:hypothetical protein